MSPLSHEWHNGNRFLTFQKLFPPLITAQDAPRNSTSRLALLDVFVPVCGCLHDETAGYQVLQLLVWESSSSLRFNLLLVPFATSSS